MDKNKLAMLQDIGYIIPKTCGLCTYGSFRSNPQSLWGGCTLMSYDHRKHTATSKPLSIYFGGSCLRFKRAVDRTVGAYEEFIDG